MFFRKIPPWRRINTSIPQLRMAYPFISIRNDYPYREGEGQIQIHERFNHVKSNINNKNPDGIYVQVLPVVVVPSNSNLPGQASIKSSYETQQASQCKILLCKWNSGDFKDRYTGLIKALTRWEYDTVIQHHQNNRSKEKHSLLLESAKALIPSPLRRRLGALSLVGLLRFEDAPVYDEYIYLANLIVSGSTNNGESDSGDEEMEFFRQEVAFGDNSCRWFSWNEIPFQDMPADDELWYPKVLQQQKKVTGSFTFGAWTEKTIKSYQLQTVQQIE